MTQEDIINAAFQVWGRDLYKTTSLAMVARELGVTKPALYRHFSGKEALMDALYTRFFDHYAAVMRKLFDQAREIQDGGERLLLMVRSITGYYTRNREYFIFSLIQVLGNKESRHNMMEQLGRRGVSMGEMREYIPSGNGYPSLVLMASITAIFYTGLFHKARHKTGTAAIPEQEIDVFVAQTEEKIAGGLGFKREEIDSLDYERLEGILGSMDEPDKDDGLLKAVADAVAEAGPWNASMDMVARRSGLSKSGLYAHFKSKQDMLGQLFYTELNRIARRADIYARMSAVPAERLYLAVLSIADYFRSRPAILIALDWIRIQRMEIHINTGQLIYDTFADLRVHHPEGAGNTSPELITQWILFLIVSTLMRRPDGMDFACFPNESIRILFRFISLGIKGWQYAI
jgi:AcrR family transcriptional regulator